MTFSESYNDAKKWLLGTRNVQEAESGIQRDMVWKTGLDTWRKRTRNTAIGLAVATIAIKLGPLLVLTLVAGAAYGAVKLAIHQVDKDIERKKEASATLTAAPQPAPSPSPKVQARPGAAATAAFKKAPAPVASAPAATANDAAPKQKSFLKRFGIGS